jgi:hypothetical protein
MAASRRRRRRSGARESALAHAARRLGGFGYRADGAPQVTDRDREPLAQADELTRKRLEPAYSALQEPEGDNLLSGLAEMKSLLPVPQLPG